MPAPAFLAALASGGLHARDYASLLHANGLDGSTTFTDEAGRSWTRNGTNTAISTSQSKFGGASLSIGSGGQTGAGTNNGIITPNTSDLEFDNADLTIEWQQYWRSLTTYQTAFDKGQTGTGGLLAQTGNGDGRYLVYVQGSIVISESSAPALNTWVQYQLKRVRSGANDTWTLTRDGVAISSGLVGHVNLNSTAAFAWGAYADGTYATDSYLDEMRVTKGLARAYSTQTAEWPN